MSDFKTWTSDISIRTTIESKQVRHLLDKLQGKRFHQALSVGLNNSARQVMGRSASVVAKRMGMPAKRARGQFHIRPFASAQSLTASVVGSGRRIPLKDFKAKATAKGVSAAPWAIRRVFPHTFFVRNGEKTAGVFKREGAKRLMTKGRYKGKMRQPIEQLWGPGIASTMAEKVVFDELVAYGEERITANVLRQLERYARVKTPGVRPST